MYSLLKKLDKITIEVHELLNHGDLDNSLKKIKQRGEIIKLLQSSPNNKINFTNDNTEHQDKITTLINSIIDLDAKNRKVIKLQIDNTYQLINDFIKEKRTVNNLRSISNVDQKPMVDIRSY